MSLGIVTLFYALLALVANVIVLVVFGAAVAAPRSPRVSAALARARAALAESGLAAACGVALLATLGSLYFSEVAGFEPCRLCWYQRIAMYPLVVLLGIAALRRDRAVRPYAMALATIGAAIATYHVALEWFPSLESGACAVGIPCTLVWFREFGFISLPYLALSAFLLVAALLWLTPPAGNPDGSRPDRSHP